MRKPRPKEIIQLEECPSVNKCTSCNSNTASKKSNPVLLRDKKERDLLFLLSCPFKIFSASQKTFNNTCESET